MKSIIDYTNKLKDFFAQKQALSDEVVTRATLGAKNLLPNNAVSQVIDGIQFAVNSDGSVTLNTVGTRTTFTTLTLSTPNLPSNDYIVSGCPSGGSQESYYLNFKVNDSWSGNQDYGSGKEVTGIINEVGISVPATYSPSNVTFYPMIRLASDTDPTYQPYAMTNKELTDAVGTSDIANLGDGTINDAIVATNAAVVFDSTTTTFEEFAAAVALLLSVIKVGQYIPNLGSNRIKAVPLCGRKTIHFGTTDVEYGSGILIQNADRVTGYVMSFDLSHFVVFRFRTHYGDQSSYNIIF